MRKKEKKSLEDMTISVGDSITLPQFESLHDFETKIRKIARKYGGKDTIHQEGSHRDIEINKERVGWSPRQKGQEDVLSSGVFRSAIDLISKATGVPYDQLSSILKGLESHINAIKKDLRKSMIYKANFYKVVLFTIS